MSLDMPRGAHSVDQYFDKEAAIWIRRYAEEPAFQTRLATIGPVVIRATRESEGTRVLDFGGGAGVFSAVASTHATMVLTLDRSREMLRAAPKHPEELSRLAVSVGGDYRPDRVHRVAGDLATFGDHAKGVFDLVMSISVLEYIDDVPAIIRNFAWLLRPGGRMILQVPNRRSPYRYIRVALSRAERIGRVVGLVRQQSDGGYMAVRPHGDRVPWRFALTAAGMSIVDVERVAIGSKGPFRWFHPNLLVVAMKPTSTN
jgi:2-polyprenyl-3-methyl-5-hydroxy-6-metoxy-1,4-benzoquinol methylase